MKISSPVLAVALAVELLAPLAASPPVVGMVEFPAAGAGVTVALAVELLAPLAASPPVVGVVEFPAAAGAGVTGFALASTASSPLFYKAFMKLAKLKLRSTSCSSGDSYSTSSMGLKWLSFMAMTAAATIANLINYYKFKHLGFWGAVWLERPIDSRT